MKIYRITQPVSAPPPEPTPNRAKTSLRISRAFYLLFFASIGALIPFFNVYLQQAGLTGAQIGWLGSVPPLISLIATPFWGAVADRWQVHKQVLVLLALVAGGVSPFFLVVDGFWWFMVLVVILYFFRNPVMSLLDSTVMDLVNRTGQSYGRQRMWGTLGFISAIFGLGQFISVDDLSVTFWLHALLIGVGCAGLGMLLPVNRAGPDIQLRRAVGVLLGQRSYLNLLLVVLLVGMGISAHIGFLGLQILALGGTEKQLAWAWVANSVMEIPIMYFGARWFGRIANWRLILLGGAGFALVWGLIALSFSAVMVIGVVLGSGVSFGIFWVATVSYASQAAPPGLSATAQALVGAAMNGIGWSLGSVVAGYLWDGAGGHAVFAFASLAAGMATVIFWASQVRR